MQLVDTRSMMADAKFFEAYSRHNGERYETWEESVSRVMDMHRERYADEMTPELEEAIQFAQDAYNDKLILGAQRALQFGGEQLFKHNIRMYNCVSSYCDRERFFGEFMYMLLCGAGAGFSVQHHHINKLPDVIKRGQRAKTHTVDDSIEGWATAVDVLLSSFFETGGVHPEYSRCHISFDLSQIRPKGAMISGGFKAPGPEPLRKALDLIEAKLVSAAAEGNRKLKPIEAYDICMYAADAVIAGGVRRSATICLFSKDDEDMLNSKTGNWFVENPQRGRSNNSAMILRDEVTRGEFFPMMESIKQFGEPGFIFTESLEHTFNPCVEIGKKPVTVKGISGWQGCNLAEINGGACTTVETFFRACKAASIICTLQAGYTKFRFLSEESKEIFEREALIGVSVTGWMNNPDVLFDEGNMAKGANLVKVSNRYVAELIGINPAARTTCVKPSGNASVLLGTASGIHGEHSPQYLRHVQMTWDSEVVQAIQESNPHMVTQSVWTDASACIAFPVVSPEGSIYKDDLLGIKQLEYVKKAQTVWIEEGNDSELTVDNTLRHNVSNTISVADDQWDEVAEYVFANRAAFAGISFLGTSGDKDYAQAPNTKVMTSLDLLLEYGDPAIFASGLIVDALNAFNGDLWAACSAVQWESDLEGSILKVDWARRYKQFADNYFGGNLTNASYCLKDVNNLHKWNKIQRNLKEIDWTGTLTEKQFTDIDTMGAQACQGGQCEI